MLSTQHIEVAEVKVVALPDKAIHPYSMDWEYRAALHHEVLLRHMLVFDDDV